MKIEKNSEWKAKFSSLYLYQKVMMIDCLRPDYLVTLNPSYIGTHVSGLHLKLRSLLSITDKEAIEVAEIVEPIDDAYHTSKWGRKWVENIMQNTILPNTLELTDYLRSQGFALSFMGKSVSELEEWGWIKLIENPILNTSIKD